MGMGDEVLVTGEARRLYEADEEHRRVLVCGIDGRPRWSPLWRDNPRILHPGEVDEGKVRHQVLTNGPRCRFYIDYEHMRADFAAVFPGKPFNPKVRNPLLPWRFTSHRCVRGDLPFVAVKDVGPRGYVIIEPHTKVKAPNRQWGWNKWQRVVDLLPHIDWLQINPRGEALLKGVRHIAANKFTDACRLMTGATAFVGAEGGLYHAAAALDVPAVAIFGGFVSPKNQGYDGPRYANLYEPMDGKSPCGQRVRCGHCEEAMARITPEIVARHVERVLDA